MLHANSADTLNKFIAFSIGPGWYEAGYTQTVWSQSNYANTYAAQHSLQALTRGELFLGMQRTFISSLITQLGLDVAINAPASLQGKIWETADPVFDNFTYHYKVSNVTMLAKTKWLATHFNPRYLPYLSAACGIAINKSYSFTMQPLIFEALPVPGFQNQQEASFTYTLGAGVHRVLTSHWQLGMGYEWSDWGRSSLGTAPGQTVGNGLRLNHLITQQLQFTLNYQL